MQRRVFNCATIRVANTTGMSGTATADEINHGLQTAEGSELWRIACSTCIGSLMLAGLFLTLAPMPAHGDDDKDRRGDNDKDRRAEIAALQARVGSLQSTVSSLQGQVSALQTANADLQNEVATLQNQLAHAKNVLALDPFVSVDPNPEIGVIGPNIIFNGANIHIVSGSGMTNDNGNPRGLGNLIIGYDESPPNMPVHFDGVIPGLEPGDRGGSHNLVIGKMNKFTRAAFGGFVAGEWNTISNEGASVSGGGQNTASGHLASVSGGGNNTASGENMASVSGGNQNTASGNLASVSGGSSNTASGGAASVSGGDGNTASGDFASITGGFLNIASAEDASVTGGDDNAAGPSATVSGGEHNIARGVASVVLGGQNVTNNKNNSIAPQPPFP